MDYKYLNGINSPKDLKKLPEDAMIPLASEIRDFLVEKVGKNGGHLASNLGVVELTLAIHRIFDVPHDHLIFDVGHQSYVHKIITGRRDRFDTLRTGNGISGFTKMSESEYDCFGAGHSSTSVSAGLGFAQADKLSDSDAYTIVVLGDGSFTGGMIHEALNNCKKNLRLIIILNENEMSISKNIGSFARLISRLRISSTYLTTKKLTGSILLHIPFVGKHLYNFVRNTKRDIKDNIYGSNYFENMGLFYIGPIDGNNEKQLEEALKNAKASDRSVLVHIKTQKGKGYAPAEKDPRLFHGISAEKAADGPDFSSAFGEKMIEMAGEDERICAISAAMIDGTGLENFREAYPKRTFDVGIAEEHAVTYACGLAAAGMKPFVAIYSTFLQRSYDNIIHDMALQKLPVTLCIDRAGLNASDGPTHHGIFDVAFLSQIPNITVFSPATIDTLRYSLEKARTLSTPCAIRYSKGSELSSVKKTFYKDEPIKDIGIRCSFSASDEIDALLITHGRIVAEAIKASEILLGHGVRLGIILAEIIKPYDALAEKVDAWIPEKKMPVVTLEEEIRAGGFGMMLLDALSVKEKMKNKDTFIFALNDTFAENYDSSCIYRSFGIDGGSIAEKISDMLREGEI